MFKRVDEMLTLFDLHRYEDVSPATLGYGERRAVALSSVLAMRTPILVLDEPTAGLDHRLAARFLGTIEKLNQRGVTIVMISHDMRAVYRYCTQCAGKLGGRKKSCSMGRSTGPKRRRSNLGPSANRVNPMGPFRRRMCC